jgi:hypothetical protein
MRVGHFKNAPSMFEFRFRARSSYLTADFQNPYHLVDVGDLGLKDGNGVTN